jgi:hypothetical protein
MELILFDDRQCEHRQVGISLGLHTVFLLLLIRIFLLFLLVLLSTILLPPPPCYSARYPAQSVQLRACMLRREMQQRLQ